MNRGRTSPTGLLVGSLCLEDLVPLGVGGVRAPGARRGMTLFLIMGDVSVSFQDTLFAWSKRERKINYVSMFKQFRLKAYICCSINNDIIRY